jgi:hypothetical protein
MPFTWIRIKAIELGLTLKTICDEGGFEYTRFSKILNGFQKPDCDFSKRCQEALNRLEERKRKITV